MATITITYFFTLPDRKIKHAVTLDKESLSLIRKDSGPMPFWADLSFKRCSHCPLDESIPYCPVAQNLTGIVELFSQVASYDNMEVIVKTRERYYFSRVTAQKALSSLMGLLIAVSRCPYTHFLKPMARFHQPFSSEEETTIRATSLYLLGNLLNDNRTFDLQELKTSYKNLELLNRGIAERMKAASEEDAAANAIVNLDMFAKAMPFHIEDALEEIRHIFK